MTTDKVPSTFTYIITALFKENDIFLRPAYLVADKHAQDEYGIHTRLNDYLKNEKDFVS